MMSILGFFCGLVVALVVNILWVAPAAIAAFGSWAVATVGAAAAVSAALTFGFTMLGMVVDNTILIIQATMREGE